MKNWTSTQLATGCQRGTSLCLFLSALVCVVLAQDQTCDGIGTEARQPFEANTAHAFYLNAQDAATCDGTIDQFEYCYNRTRSSMSAPAGYEFTFALYKETKMGTYKEFSSAFSIKLFLSATSPGFECGEPFVVDPPIKVKEGDMIGACIYDPPEDGEISGQLDIVGRDIDTDQERFLLTTGNEGCGPSTVPYTVSSLNMEQYLTLHIWAHINSKSDSDSTMGTLPTITTECAPEQSDISPTNTVDDGSASYLATSVGVSTAATLTIVIVGIVITTCLVFVVVKRRQGRCETRNSAGNPCYTLYEALPTGHTRLHRGPFTDLHTVRTPRNVAYGVMGAGHITEDTTTSLSWNEAYSTVRAPSNEVESDTEGDVYYSVVNFKETGLDGANKAVAVRAQEDNDTIVEGPVTCIAVRQSQGEHKLGVETSHL